MGENDCRNFGFVLDGYPRNEKDCQFIFNIGKEGGEKIIPSFVYPIPKEENSGEESSDKKKKKKDEPETPQEDDWIKLPKQNLMLNDKVFPEYVISL